MIAPSRRPSPMVAIVAAAALLTAACSADPEGQGRGHANEMVARVASYDLVAGRTGRFIVGLLAADRSRLVGYGTVELTFTYLGARGSVKATGPAGQAVTAQFLAIPGQKIDPAASGPRFVEGSEGIGIYGAPDVTFDRPGFWEVTATAVVDGTPRQAQAAFEVLERSAIPAPGDPAPHTEHPVVGTADVDPRSIDSRAGPDVAVPDPELHTTTIAAALDAGRPLMVVVSTPTYCQSRFCGPITDSVSALAKRHGDVMDFVHLEMWKDFEKGELNEAAAAWVFPSGTDDAREPWVFVVGRDGRITHRFDNVVSDAELEQVVAGLTG
jgi:hypothetical protein